MENIKMNSETMQTAGAEHSANHLWGKQTQMCVNNFRIGTEKMPSEIIRAIAMIKGAAALANAELVPGRMTPEKRDLIADAARAVAEGGYDGEFPLPVWQTGSGTQTNMNVNEVIANIANAGAGYELLHPNDDVNMSQSTNDVFPSSIHLSLILAAERSLIPALEGLYGELTRLSFEYRDTEKCGRTHLRDATPVTFGQEISGWAGAVRYGIDSIKTAVEDLRALPLGGTAVGTGINAPEGFALCVTRRLSEISGTRVYPDQNRFHSMSCKSRISRFHSALKTLAGDLTKIANDIRWLSSGPRTGLGEITIPANEPGSSIMPGKVNPTQCEALIMVCMRVMGNDESISLAASAGNFELNVTMPLIAYCSLQSVNLLSDAADSFTEKCVKGIRADEKKMKYYKDISLMNATSLSPLIGYDGTAKVVELAAKAGITLREACLKLNLITAEKFDSIFGNKRVESVVRLCDCDYRIREATLADIPELDRIFASARERMKASGNPYQWGDSRPPHDAILSDISHGQMYIVECTGRCVGCFALVPGDDPTYSVIYDGTWLSDEPYYTIHRIASDGSVSGLFDACLGYCLQKTSHIRIDTHADNNAMKHILKKRGFSRRGIIHLLNEDEREAYELN